MGEKIIKGRQTLDVSDFRHLRVITHNEVGRALASKLVKDPDKTGASGYLGKRGLEDGVFLYLFI